MIIEKSTRCNLYNRLKSSRYSSQPRSTLVHFGLPWSTLVYFMYSMYIQCVSNVYSMCTQCVFNVFSMCFQSVFNLHSMRIQCVFNVHSMCIQCAFNVHSMRIQCVFNHNHNIEIIFLCFILMFLVSLIFNFFLVCSLESKDIFL